MKIVDNIYFVIQANKLMVPHLPIDCKRGNNQQQANQKVQTYFIELLLQNTPLPFLGYPVLVLESYFQLLV